MFQKAKLPLNIAAAFVPRKLKDKVRASAWKYGNLHDARKVFREAMRIARTREEKLRLLKKHLKIIAFECFSYCNRKCWFCENSRIDRYSFNQYLPEETFLRVLDTLAEIEYEGNVSWAQFNEPLADVEVTLKRVRQARKHLPKAFFFMFTNSDYLSKEVMYELDAAGCNFLAPQCYRSRETPYDIEKNVKPQVEAMLGKLGIAVGDTEERWAFMHSFSRQYFLPTGKKMLVCVICPNWDVIGMSRGSIADVFAAPLDRREPCQMPLYRLHVTYTGEVMPCGEFRIDAENARQFVIGDANVQPLEDIFCCEKAVKFRRHLMRYGAKCVPCNRCKGGIEADFTKTACLQAYSDFLCRQEAARQGGGGGQPTGP